MNQLVLTIVIDASNLVTSWPLAPRAKLRNCNTIYQRQCSKKFKLHRCLRLGLFLMNQNFVFFYFEKFLFFFLYAFFSISRVKWGSIKQNKIRGDRRRNDPSSTSISWLLVTEKEKKKETLAMLLIGFFLAKPSAWVFFFASSSSCTFLFFSVASLLSCSFSWCIFGCPRLSFWGYG